jgi:chromosomal replication initiation ATPase DnaA
VNDQPSAGPGAVASPRQLVLALGHQESVDRADFLVGDCNRDALHLIDRWPDWPAPGVALVGPEGAGKSHLAAIWAAKTGAQIVSRAAVDVGSRPEVLATGALVIEDSGRDDGDETALFHLLNLANEQRVSLLITARRSPASWPVALPDLASRLRVVPVVAIAPPDDALLAAVMIKLFADRQLKVDDRLVSYLLSRIDRSFAAVRAAVEELDREALRLKRRVNRALAAEVLRRHAP